MTSQGIHSSCFRVLRALRLIGRMLRGRLRAELLKVIERQRLLWNRLPDCLGP